MSDSNFQYDSSLVRELRKMALDGAQPVDLIRHIQAREGYAPDYIVPVLAYLRHTFEVSLRTILPLWEEMGVGPESRTLRIVFWFAAAMLTNGDCLPWDWPGFRAKMNSGFNPDDLVICPGSNDEMKIEYRQTGDGVFARGTLGFIEHNEAFVLTDQAIRERIRAFAREYRETVDRTVNGFPGEYATRMTLDFQIQPNGSNCRIVCKVWTLKELVKHKAEPSLVPA